MEKGWPNIRLKGSLVLNTMLKHILLKNSVCSLAFFCSADGIMLLVCYHCLNMVSSVLCCEEGEWDKNTRFYRFFFLFFRSCCRESKESWSNSRPSVNFKKFSS